MGRDRIDLQWEGQKALEELRKKEEWLKKAQALSAYIKVTEADYLKFGCLRPEEWLQIQIHPDWDEDPGWVQEDYEDYAHYEEDYHYEDEILDYDYDWDLDWGYEEDLEFGGKFYPREHVENALHYLKGN